MYISFKAWIDTCSKMLLSVKWYHCLDLAIYTDLFTLKWLFLTWLVKHAGKFSERHVPLYMKVRFQSIVQIMRHSTVVTGFYVNYKKARELGSFKEISINSQSLSQLFG